ncbi:hypothetical protein GYMLUDRAFT_86213, partial [Collybiopsis luxurians FD-317 M1]
MSGQVQDPICLAESLCLSVESASYTVTTQIIVPIALEVMFYGIFAVFFGLSVYIFRRRFLPGKLYVIATVLFFLLAS